MPAPDAHPFFLRSRLFVLGRTNPSVSIGVTSSVQGARKTLAFFFRLILATLVAVALGVGSAYYLVLHGTGQQDIVINGPWRTSLAAGGVDADMYTRAHVALVGLLALNKTETIYYTANRDSRGEPFDPACSYRIEGRDPDARWWSITAYGRDFYLIPNPQKKYAVGKTNMVRAADGSFIIRLSQAPVDGNWIATSPDGFEITLRLYNPGPRVLANADTVELPTITRETCS